ncbi:hypothetical protein SAMN02787142_4325 [Burkholderia sp. WP9]|nr:hypothetical protein SAMN02787142_4325 [Burkholderia sp. WP9]
MQAINQAESAQSGASRDAAAINQTIRRVVGDHTGLVHEFTRPAGVTWVEFSDKAAGWRSRRRGSPCCCIWSKVAMVR